MNTYTFDYKPKMTKKKLVEKIKKYLDATKNTNEDAKRYAEQLLEWINIWEKR